MLPAWMLPSCTVDGHTQQQFMVNATHRQCADAGRLQTPDIGFSYLLFTLSHEGFLGVLRPSRSLTWCLVHMSMSLGEASSDESGSDSEASEEDESSDQEDDVMPPRGLHNLLQPELLGPSGSDWGELQLADDDAAAAAAAGESGKGLGARV
jgi:hypothetical protein